MPQYEILNQVSHKHLKICTGYSTEFGDNIPNALTFPTEFAEVQKEYPIFFRKDGETGEFSSFVMLGMQEDENLYLQNNQWKARYIPAILARGPFLIGFQNQESRGGNPREPVINIDMENPRINESAGEALFLADGFLSPYANQISQTLQIIHNGMEANKAMFAVFNEFNLIEAVAIDIELDNGQKIQLQGTYTIQEENLMKLDGLALEKLNKSGFLHAAYLVISSLSNVKKLIEMKNQQIAGN